MFLVLLDHMFGGGISLIAFVSFLFMRCGGVVAPGVRGSSDE